jgi:pimeloyl-ACP methyl ester carboxylesterase
MKIFAGLIKVGFIYCGVALPGIALSQAELSIKTYVYDTSTKGEVKAEIGQLRVLENRRRPDSRRIDLVFVRLAGTPGAKGPPIVYLSGGPGGSGINAGEGSRYRLFEALRASGDVILLDQRGTGRSTGIEPEDCPEEASYPLDHPLELKSYLAMVEKNALFCRKFWRDHGVDLDAYTTMDSVADLEALRVALEVDQLDLIGISYGSHLALACLRQHPKRVRRIIFAGTEGPDHTEKLPAQFDAQLDNLQALIDTDDSKARIDVRKLIGDVLDVLKTTPFTLRITDVEGPDQETSG